MIPNQITPTYVLRNGKMIHDGYYIYGNGASLQWISIKDIRRV